MIAGIWVHAIVANIEHLLMYDLTNDILYEWIQSFCLLWNIQKKMIRMYRHGWDGKKNLNKF